MIQAYDEVKLYTLMRVGLTICVTFVVNCLMTRNALLATMSTLMLATLQFTVYTFNGLRQLKEFKHILVLGMTWFGLSLPNFILMM